MTGPLLSLLAAASLLATGGSISGDVIDPFDATVAEARVSLMSGAETALLTTATDERGRFLFDQVPTGSYQLVARFPGFDETRRAVHLGEGEELDLTLELSLSRLTGEVSVSAEAGRVTSTENTTQAVNIIDETEIARRATAVLAEAVQGESGVQLQRTSPAIAGVYVRGLGGRNVSVFVDGIRYSTASQRGGIKTFLSLVEPSSLRAIEVLRGPQGSQYGSASLGGSLQLVSRAPELAIDGTEFKGRATAAATSVDEGAAGSAGFEIAGERASILLDVYGRRVNQLRPGDGIDRHAAVTRFLGLPSSVIGGDRLPDTEFTSYGGLLRTDWAIASGQHLTVSYRRGQTDGATRYDRLLGGDGDSLADIRGLKLDLGSVRYETSRLPYLDALSVTGSFNSQREERVRQGGNGDPTAQIRHQYERTSVFGLNVRGHRSFGPEEELAFGAEIYDETVEARAHGRDPITQEVQIRRPRIPDGAAYRSAGIWLDGSIGAIPNRLRLFAAARMSYASYSVRAADSPTPNGEPLWSDFDADVSDFTYRIGALATLSPRVSLTASLSRGFRAPSVTDLGTLGLTGSGYEVAAPDLAGLGATVGSSAGDEAISLGTAVDQIRAENSLSYEVQGRFTGSWYSASLGVFINDINGAVEKRAVILPEGAIGIDLGGELVTRQTADGAIYVDASSTPVLVRANISDIRVWGVEQSFDAQLSRDWSLHQSFTYLKASDRDTGEPPSISGATPAPDGALSLRWQPSTSRFWLEATVRGVLRQTRLSSLALQDRRIGAFRTRDDIAAFFQNGATVRGLVDAGADARLGTDDDLLAATGETLAEVQQRVLGDADGAPLFSTLPGYVTLDLHAGVRLRTRHLLGVDLTNLLDQNHRGMAWGMPGPGRALRLRISTSF